MGFFGWRMIMLGIVFFAVNAFGEGVTSENMATLKAVTIGGAILLSIFWPRPRRAEPLYPELPVSSRECPYCAAPLLSHQVKCHKCGRIL